MSGNRWRVFSSKAWAALPCRCWYVLQMMKAGFLGLSFIDWDDGSFIVMLPCSASFPSSCLVIHSCTAQIGTKGLLWQGTGWALGVEVEEGQVPVLIQLPSMWNFRNKTGEVLGTLGQRGHSTRGTDREQGHE